ncbi:hypothetical protein K469DRAFT_727425 [Zopfia rhizophila CBS 207.26]|uniref:Amidohydrolase-related domain-containing protein n=1 Tax=Zopfia rhizophila CBS 207.26 TaxID=1314779 RepID=A0A6A6ES07_9PEZI|nr:hypothetical protein K469DRAFT_727425 [Zopfia rhizophila CBS 207.26]
MGLEIANANQKHENLFPNGGWDVHHHIFEPSRFAYAPDRHLTPPPATIRHFLDFKSRLGITHSVITHGLSYGDDCTSLKSFVTELGHKFTQGIGVIDPATVTAAELEEMHESGIRGIRINLYKYGAMHDVHLQKIVLREHARVLQAHCPGWTIAFTHVHPEFWKELKPVIEQDIAPASDVTSQPGFRDIIGLVRAGILWVKISAPYRVSEMMPIYEDPRPIVRALVDANPRQVVWGSDWPHTPRMKVRDNEEALKETPFLEVDDLEWLRSLRSWLSDAHWDQIMVKNPSELYAN